MRKLVFYFLFVLLLVGCSEKQVSPEVQARRESREIVKKEREESMSAAKESREANKKAREESKAIAEAENIAMHDKYDKVIIDNDVVKITLTTKMSSHDNMACVIENKTNRDIVLVALPTYIKTNKSNEEIYNEHTDLFPREVKANQVVDSKFFVTFNNKADVGINNYDDYFDEDGKVRFRTHLNIYESHGDNLDKVSETFNNPLYDGDMEFDVYRAD